MGWDVALMCGDTHCQVDGFVYGGIHQADPLTMTAIANHEAEFSLTYNYSRLLLLTLGRPFRELDGMTGEESLPLLTDALAKCGQEHPYEDYWAPTLGNVARALSLMADWARANPWGRWEIT